MSDTPKFTVIDRRRMKAEQEQAEASQPAVEETAAPVAEAPAEAEAETEKPHLGPRLVVNEPPSEVADEAAEAEAGEEEIPGMPPAPSAEESQKLKEAYLSAAERLEDLIRAQNPGMEKTPAVGFEQLAQQLYLSAMIQMGAGTQEGQRPRVDIVGARQTIDLLGVLAEKSQGNLSPLESRTIEAVLYETRMAFLELTQMISIKTPPMPPAGM